MLLITSLAKVFVGATVVGNSEELLHGDSPLVAPPGPRTAPAPFTWHSGPPDVAANVYWNPQTRFFVPAGLFLMPLAWGNKRSLLFLTTPTAEPLLWGGHCPIPLTADVKAPRCRHRTPETPLLHPAPRLPGVLCPGTAAATLHRRSPSLFSEASQAGTPSLQARQKGIQPCCPGKRLLDAQSSTGTEPVTDSR